MLNDSIYSAFLISKLCITTHPHASIPIFVVDFSVLTLNDKTRTAPPSQQKEIEQYRLKTHTIIDTIDKILIDTYSVTSQQVIYRLDGK